MHLIPDSPFPINPSHCGPYRAKIKIIETTDVIICGCGLTEPAITTDPRGIALDDDGIRFLQGLGLYDNIYTKTCMGNFGFVSGADCDMHKKPILALDYNTTAGVTGHAGFIGHKQPVLEIQMREVMHPSFCSLQCNSTVISLNEDKKWTVVLFFVGADGKTGYTQKHYLEAKSVILEKFHDAFYEETWVALNWQITVPTPQSHPNFPLWHLGYTPEQVYDQFFPPEFRFLCNPDRPAVCGRFGLPADQLWRFEYIIRSGEDGFEMAKPEVMRRIVFPYLTHSGSRYKLSQPVQFPEDCIEVPRCRPFSFSSRTCNMWSKDRVILCGDAAHVFPPSSGFRDAISLSWRLATLCRYQPTQKSHHQILKAWHQERKQQLELSLATTVENGRMVCETHPINIFVRDWYLRFIQLIPSWRRQLQHGQRKTSLVQYRYSAGMPFMPDLNGGLYLPQVYCRTMERKKIKSLFRLFVYLESSSELIPVTEALERIDEWSRREFHSNDIPIILETIEMKDQSKTRSVFQIASAEEFAGSPLCDSRPKPLDYDPHLLRDKVQGRYIIVRPDRFIFASCQDTIS
ncbi:monooxygenase [Aspergillus heteromorphus CBS 117.55]|uniref:Monooxygenase n=1 Tax=Aspergillus heteromorphus CBS 117.55 TaxID=1448321 RepID=A0A317VL34_9EURO|nr:monooxygenase [Aspergillus heteromorphus CBS 117.55]PWY75026.1 monooxygenase [Aspergillus heteromorphus CBS 117.55]